MTEFQAYILRWYQAYGRHDLPWRLTSDPYAILVSEIMLQQTQVERVRQKYLDFLALFPNALALAQAELSDVLTIWQGLGYNRRAKYLWQAAQVVIRQGGTFPTSVSALAELPGVGSYTAAAVSCFSTNQPVILLETNIRAVFLYHFCPDRRNVAEKEILSIVEACIERENPRRWYWALMDYGSFLKKTTPNPNRRSRQYNKQSPFSGSRRQARGEIVRILTKHSEANVAQLRGLFSTSLARPEHFDSALTSLIQDGLVMQCGIWYRLGNTAETQ